MKIRNRLAIILTLSSALILLIVSISVYYLSITSRKNDFFNRLKERVKITEQLFLEKDNLENQVYQDIREKFLHILPGEIEIVEKIDNIESPLNSSIKNSLPHYFLKKLIKNSYAQFQEEKKQGVGRVYTINNQSYAVIVTAIDQYGIAHTNKLMWLLIIGFVVSILFIFLSGRLLARQALKPITLKIKKAQSISASNLNDRLVVYNKKDELGQLTIAFNALLDRLQEAFETQRNFVRNASHEIKNPLTAIIGETEVILERERTPDEYIVSINNINKEAFRLNELVNDFLNLAKVGYSGYEKNLVEVRLDEIILEAKKSIDKTNPENKINFDFSKLPINQQLLNVKGNEHLLKIAFINLMDNACKFSKNKEVMVSLTYDEKTIKLKIKDQGIGIKDIDKNKIFQPLYRADNARFFKGTGLGLSIVYRITELHKVSVKIKSEPNIGTSILLYFPIV